MPLLVRTRVGLAKKVKEEPVGDATPGGGSKRRGSSLGLGGGGASSRITPKKKKAKAELADNVGGVDLCESEAEVVGEGIYECMGCARSNAVHSSYMLPGGEVEFFYASGRFCFCKECYTVWRLMYKGRLTLAQMPRCLSMVANRTRFYKELVALLSLRFEHCARATAQGVSQRVEMLEFVFGVCGVPWPFVELRSLREVDLVAHPADSLGFCELTMDKVRRVLAMVPASAIEVNTPGASGHNLQLPVRRQQGLQLLLRSDLEEDNSWWAEHMATGAPLVDGEVVAEEAPGQRKGAEVEGQSPPQTISGKKASSALESTMVALADFTDDKYMNLQERTLTKHLQKLLKVQNDILRAPDGATYAPMVRDCVEAVNSAKEMFQPLVVYEKTFAGAKLALAFKASAALGSFFEANGMQFGPGLRRTLWRAKFESVAAEACAAAAEMLKSSEADLLSMAKGDRSVVADFVGDCITNVVATYLESEVAEQATLDAVRDELVAQLDAFLVVLQALRSMDGHMFVDIMRAARTVLDAAAPETRILPGQLIAAKATLEADAASKVMLRWFGSEPGVAVMAEADLILAASALDAESLTEFSLAEKVLSSDIMPVVAESGVLAGDIARALDGEVNRYATDAMKQVSTSMMSWSPAGVEEHMQRVIAVLRRLRDVLVFCDVVRTWHLLESWFGYVDEWDTIFSDLPLDQKAPLISDKVAADAASALSMEGSSESDGQASIDFLGQLTVSLGHLKARDEEVRGAIESLEQVADQCGKHLRARESLTRLCSTRASVLVKCHKDMPVGVTNLLQQYLGESGGGGSVVELAVRLAEAAKLEDHGKLFEAHKTGNMIQGVLENGDEVEIDQTEVVQRAGDLSQPSLDKYVERRFVSGPAEQVLGDWWGELSFLALAEVPEKEELAALSSSQEVLLKLVPGGVIKRLADDFGNGVTCESQVGEHLTSLRISRKCDLVVRLLRLMSDADLSADQFAEKLTCMTALKVLPLFNDVGKLLATMSFIHGKLGQGQSSSVVVASSGGGLVVDASIKVGVEAVKQGIARISASLVALSDAIKEAGCRAGVRTLEFLLAAYTVWHDKVVEDVFSRAALKIEEATKICENACPRWGHIVSGGAYKANLARRQLLSGPRSSLAPTHMRLGSISESVQSLHKYWGLPGTPESCSSLTDALAASAAVLEMAELAMAVVAAVNVIEEFSNRPEGKAYAQELLQASRPTDFPKILEAKLLELAGM